MKRFCALVCLVVGSMTALACGGNAVVDGAGVSTGTATGEGAGPTACPIMPSDSGLMEIVDQPCATAGATCESFDDSGCGNCTSTCSDGIWGPPECIMIMDC